MLREIPVSYVSLSNGEKLAYRKIGDKGETLLLIHGNMSSSIFFDTLMENLEDDYIIYAVDMRGFGDSSYHKPIESLADFAYDIKLFIEVLGLNNLIIAGWSTGGGVALELAADLKEKVKKVMLIESVGIKGYPIFKKDAEGKPILTELLSSYEDIANDPIQVKPAVTALETKNKEFFRNIYNLLIYNKRQPESLRYERYLEAIVKQRNLIDVDYALVHFNLTNESNGVCEGNNRKTSIKAPILIIQGEDDLVVPAVFAHETKKQLGDIADLVIFKDSGHSPLTDQLEKLIKVINTFIKEGRK
ncbi:alpha/beta hydrolase [Mycoplasmatota bacterium]|nr:alpha/beta hydrolase [Mycoplasmatota bacterium]